MHDILFTDLTVLCGEDFEVMTNAYIGVSDSRIDYLSTFKPTSKYSLEISCRGQVAMAGLINCHTHLPMSSLRGIGENLPLSRWLNEKIFPYEDKMQGEIYYYNTLLSIAEAISYGTTSVTDMYFGMEYIAKAILDSGIRANISRSLVSFDGERYDGNERVKEAELAYELHNGADNGRILVNPSIHAEYTNTDSFLTEFHDKNKNRNATHLHLSETDYEVSECMKRHKNLTPVAYFNEKNILSGAICAHCVSITEVDAMILAENNASVVHCPTSNLKLGSGVSPLHLLLSKGVNIALGTDGQASQNNLDMFFEMKLAAILHKGINKDPSIIGVKDVLRMATAGGAKAQGRTDTGILALGYKADIIFLDITSPNMTPIHNILNTIVYSTSSRDISRVMVDGKILYDGGEYFTIDIKKIKQKVNELNAEIVDNLNS